MLKIESWSLYAAMLPYSTPVLWATGSEEGAPVLILRLQASDGRAGIGEVAVKPAWYGATYSSLIGALQDLFLPLLKGLDVTDPCAFHRAASMYPENMPAKTIVDNALWDLSAASLAKPLWQQWGGEPVTRVCWLVSRQAEGAMIDEAVDAVERMGIRALKMKGGQGLEFDLRVIKQVQAAVGSAVQLFIDANWHYTEQQAPEYLARLADLGIVAFEDPYELAPNRRFEAIQRDSKVPLIVDFFASTVRDVALFHERGLQALSLKPARIGFTEALLQSRYAAEHGIRVHIGFGGESSVGSFSALQLGSSLWCRDSWLPAEVIYFLKMREDLLKERLIVRDGVVRLPAVNSVHDLLDFDKLRKLSTIELHG